MAHRALFALAGIAAASGTLLAVPPESPRIPVTDTYHGMEVVDEFRWLENWDDIAVKGWSEMQNEHARSILDRIQCVPALRARLTELENSVGVEYRSLEPAAGRIFAIKSQPPKQQPLIVALRSMDDVTGEKVILDPNVLDKEGGTSFDWFKPSPDGQYVAVSLSTGGSEAGDVHVYRVENGEELKGDVVPRVNGGTAGGTMAWSGDSKGFYYTRYPRAGERPEDEMAFYTQLYYHALGTPTEKDTYQTGKDYPKIAEIDVLVSADGKWVMTNVQNGDGGEFIQDVRSPDGKWTRLSRWDDRVVEARFGDEGSGMGGNAAYLVSRKNAPNGKILRLPLIAGKAIRLADAVEVIPEQPNASIESAFDAGAGVIPTRSRLYVIYQTGGPNELRAFDFAGKTVGTVPTLPVSSVGDVEPINASASDDLLFQNVTWVDPPAYFQLTSTNDGLGKVMRTALAVPPPPNMPKLVVKREFATSKDGTRVPVNIVMPAGLNPDGRTPTIVWGYGGYGVNQTPGFSLRRVAWCEQGNIFAIANIRGGGEYGEKWHLQGNLTKKQNVFDDFHAACEYMVEKGYTNKDKLAIMGGSNGGLLMGAMITQHPDLCKAVVSSVGIYDMLRVELSYNGEFNITEFGTVKDPEQFRALYAYSPYHHVQDGFKYPAILMLTGANDPRVDPMQSRKMTARLQEAQKAFGGGTVLLRTSGNTGHGMGTPLSARIEQMVDTYAFVFDQLEAPYRPIARGVSQPAK